MTAKSHFEALTIPTGGFGTILADPPWSFRTYAKQLKTPSRTAFDPYRVLNADDLQRMNVADLAAKHCALFMWVVRSNLPEALALGKAWGFEFKTRAFVWDKSGFGTGAKTKAGKPMDRIAMGYWSRTQTEDVWLFTKGKPRVLSHSVREIIRAPVREHSRKPDEIYGRVEALAGGPYVELFARQRWEGWSAWGNEVEKFEAAQRLPMAS